MTTNDEIIKKWIKDSNYSGFMTPNETKPMLNQARQDERVNLEKKLQQATDRMEQLVANKKVSKYLRTELTWVLNVLKSESYNLHTLKE